MTRQKVQVGPKLQHVHYEIFEPGKRGYSYVCNFSGKYVVYYGDRYFDARPGDYLVQIGEQENYFAFPPEVFKRFFRA